MGYKRKTVEFRDNNDCNKVVAYYRYSSSKQTEQSIERQIQIVEDFCKFRGFEIVANYRDEEKSGTTTQGRFGLQQMLRDIGNNVYGQIYGIVVYKTDRLTRNSSDFYAIYNNLLKCGIRTISATEGLGSATNTPSTEILLSGLFANSAQAYSQELGEKVIKGMRLSAEKGNSTGSTPPLGYRWEDKKLVVDNDKAPIIPIIFSMYGEQDKSKKEIADYLNSLGYTDRMDRPFNIKSFENLLKNKKYIGVWEYGQGEEKAELNTVDNPFNTPLISVELYNKVQAKLKQNQQLRGEKKAKVRYALSGRIYCDCEIETAGKYNLMVATGGKGGNGAKHTYHYYQCRHCKRAVRKDIIEEVVWARVQELLNQDNEGDPTIGGVNVGIVTLANKVAEQIENTTAIDYELQAMRENLQKRIKEKDNIIQAIKDNGAIAAVLANTLLETDNKIKDLTTRIQLRETDTKRQTLTKLEVLRWLEHNIDKDFTTNTDDEFIYKALRTLVQYVIVDSGLPKKPTKKDLWISLLIGMRICDFGSMLPIEAKRQGIVKEGGDNANGSNEPKKENHQQKESVGDSSMLAPQFAYKPKYRPKGGRVYSPLPYN